MSKQILAGIIAAVIIVGGVSAYLVTKNRSKEVEQSNSMEDKKSPGDSMTERAVDNTINGKQPMDEEALPSNTKPKPNGIQGSDKAMQGGVIMEGPADLK